MTFSRTERFLLLGIAYIIVIALAAVVWPKGSDSTSVSTAGAPVAVPTVSSTGNFWDIGKPTPSPSASPTRTAPLMYAVVPGDSPQIIEQKTSYPWNQIWYINAATIEDAAKAHGLTSSENGRYLYPGTVLTLPAGH